MKAKCYSCAIMLLLLTMTACGQLHPRGLIYSHITKPLSVNFSKTQVDLNNSDGNIKHVHIPFVKVDIIWSSNAIGDIARENGMETIYYADIDNLSILGIWNRYSVHIYGK